MSGFLMYGHDPLLDPIEKLVKEIGMRRMRYALLIENVRAEIGDHRTADSRLAADNSVYSIGTVGINK